jgi:hypothetical protein
MNERIKLLLLEASKYALTMNPEEDSYGHPANLGKYHLDRDTKFAELLLQECADYIDAFNRENMVEEGIDGGMVKQHFGVEE